jgi:hypothetical protein
MRPVVEGMGVSGQGQHAKLAANRERFSYQDILTTGADGKRYEMGCVPLRRYPMWLATINPAKASNPAVRQRVGDPCASVLEDPSRVLRGRLALVGAPLLLTDFLHLGVAPCQLVPEGSVGPFLAKHLGGYVSRGLGDPQRRRAVDRVVLAAERDDGGLRAGGPEQVQSLLLLGLRVDGRGM